MDTDVIKPIIEGRNRGKKHYLVIVAEGEKAKPSRSRKRLRKRRVLKPEPPYWVIYKGEAVPLYTTE